MADLSYHQVEAIKKVVGSAHLSFAHLQYDLIDHICCDVEVEMDKGQTFDRAFTEVKKRFNVELLQKIQEDTLLLIDKKYRMMKTTMKIFGVVAPILVSFGTMFKIEHWPGAGILLAIGFFLLSFVFLPSAIYVSFRELNNGTKKLVHLSGFLAGFLLSISFLFKIQHWPGTSILIFAGIAMVALLFLPSVFWDKIRHAGSGKERSVYIVGWLGATIYVLGFLLKINHWPGATIALLLGSLLLVGIAFPWYIYQRYKEEEFITNKFLFTTIALSWVILPTMLISLNLSHDVLKEFQVLEKETKSHSEFLKNKNDAWIIQLSQQKKSDTLLIAKLADLKQLSDGFYQFVDSIKTEIFKNTEVMGESAGIGSVLTGSTGNGAEIILYKKATHIKNCLMKMPGLNPDFEHQFSRLIETDFNDKTSGSPSDNKSSQILGSSLVLVMNNLECVREKVLIAESLGLQQITIHDSYNQLSFHTPINLK